jgi:hypothetical protein
LSPSLDETSQAAPPLADTGRRHRFTGIAECVFDDELVPFLTENNADRRVVIWMANLIINSREIKFIFPANSGFEVLYLQSTVHGRGPDDSNIK